jgi:LysR family transcriptional regulator for bpeEF and oprC
MDKFKAIEVFVRVVDLGNFTRAADALRMPKATVSTLVQDLEAQLGVRLLQRTTRRVGLTAEGAAYYERCARVLDDLREADEAVSSRHGQPEGRLKVDMPTSMASLLMHEAIPQFLARYPGLQLEVGCSDRLINVVNEGVDCVLRVGELRDPTLVARRVGEMRLVTVAAPSYLARHGEPLHPQDLMQPPHRGVHYFVASGKLAPFDFRREGESLSITPPGALAVNDSNAYRDACDEGLGIGQLPEMVLRAPGHEAALQPVLTDWCAGVMPVHVVFPSNRHLSTRVQAFVEWAAGLFSPPQR